MNSAAIGFIVEAMKTMIPVILDFFAKLLNINGIIDAVQGVINRIMDPIHKAINKAVEWISNLIKKLVKKFKRGGASAGEEHAEARQPNKSEHLDNAEVGKTVRFSADGENHRLWIDTAGSGVEIMVASNAMRVKDRLAKWRDRLPKLPEEKQAHAKSLLNKADSEYQDVLGEAKISKNQIKKAAEANSTAAEIDSAKKQDDIVEKKESQISSTLKELFDIFGESEDGVTADLLNISSIKNEKSLNFTEPRQGKQVVGYKAKNVQNEGIIVGQRAEGVASKFIERVREKGDYREQFNDLISKTPEERRKKIQTSVPHNKFKPVPKGEPIVNGNNTTISYGYEGGSETFTVTYNNKTNETEKVIADNISYHNFGSGKVEGDTVAGLNRAHIVANEVEGSGYAEAHNLMLTSDTFNQVTMREQEIKIGDYLEDLGKTRSGVTTFNMSVHVVRYNTDEHLEVLQWKRGLIKRKNELEPVINTIKDDEKENSGRFKEYATLEALLNLDDDKLLNTLKVNSKAKDVRRVKNVVYTITKIRFGDGPEISSTKTFRTGSDYYLGTK